MVIGSNACNWHVYTHSCAPSTGPRALCMPPAALQQVQAVRIGASGFTTGMSVGRALIEEQTSLLGSVLASMNGLLGSPYAELLWCQAVGALLVGMVSELVYCSVLVRVEGCHGCLRTCACVRLLKYVFVHQAVVHTHIRRCCRLRPCGLFCRLYCAYGVACRVTDTFFAMLMFRRVHQHLSATFGSKPSYLSTAPPLRVLRYTCPLLAPCPLH